MLKKIFIALALCYAIFIAFGVLAEGQNLDPKNIGQLIVSITSYDKDGKILARGTGFFKSSIEGELITSLSNLPAEAVRTEIKAFDGNAYEIKRRFGEYGGTNIVQLLVDEPKLKNHVYSSISNPEINERVAIISANSSSKPVITEGTIQAIED